MTHIATETLTDVHDMVVVHRAFRREFRLIPELARRVAAGDTARAKVVAARLSTGGRPRPARRSPPARNRRRRPTAGAAPPARPR
jgi:hypothetical protein